VLVQRFKDRPQGSAIVYVYLQETGRAGRDGAPAIFELFACTDDCTTLENLQDKRHITLCGHCGN